MIIAITGTPGTGKTAVGRILAKKLGYKFVSLNELARRKKLYSGYDKKRKCGIVDIGKVGGEVRKIKQGNKNIIIESHYSHRIPSDIVIVLICKPLELGKRMQRKGWNKEKIRENIESEIMEVCLSEALETKRPVLVYDTTGKTAEISANDIAVKVRRKPIADL